jgi:hypothetical protein
LLLLLLLLLLVLLLLVLTLLLPSCWCVQWRSQELCFRCCGACWSRSQLRQLSLVCWPKQHRLVLCVLCLAVSAAFNRNVFTVRA